jgi:hypothetical protein
MKRGVKAKVLDRPEVLAFCRKSRSMKELCEKFKLSGTAIKRITNELIAEHCLDKVDEKSVTSSRWMYVARDPASRKIWHYVEPPFRAHDPFNLIKRK